MILDIVRHAWAGQADEAVWPDDKLRPLTRKGRKRFARLVRRLAKRGFRPELIATSPLVRCRQTAELLADGTGGPAVVPRPELAPGGDLDPLLAWMAEAATSCQRVAWVGHSPDVERLTAALIGSGEVRLRLAKGAVATLEFDGPVKRGQGELCGLLTAETLGVK